MLTLRQLKSALPLSLLVLSSQAFSAAMVKPAAPVHVWEGPYIGAFIGGAWGSYDTSLDVGTVTATSYFVDQTNIDAVNFSGTGSFDHDSFVGGLKLGTDWVWDNFLLGAVVDFGAYSEETDVAVLGAPYPDGSGNSYTMTATYDTDWLFTLRARAGLQFAGSMPARVYATGGLAMTHLEVTNTFTDDAGSLGAGISDGSDTEAGWTVGGGVEFQITPNLSVDAEYLWVDFSDVDTEGVITNTAGGLGFAAFDFASPYNTSTSLSSSIVRVGLNYHFDA